MATARLSAADVYYEIAGSGPRVVSISGSGSDLRTQPYPLAPSLTGRFTVLAYDHRTLGSSTPHDPDHQPSMAEFAADTVELADHLGWSRFGLVGVSFGGMVAQHVALAAGDRVDALVLACTSPGGPDLSSAPLHEVYELPDDERLERSVGLLDVRNAQPGPRREAALELLRSFSPAGPIPDGFRRQLEARRHHDVVARLGEIDVPTLVCAGRHDGIAPLANSEALAGAIPGARLQVFDGGHAFVFEDTTAWPAIAAFLAEHLPADPDLTDPGPADEGPADPGLADPDPSPEHQPE